MFRMDIATLEYINIHRTENCYSHGENQVQNPGNLILLITFAQTKMGGYT